jgi:serine/threonine-protein phosphatase PGAM5
VARTRLYLVRHGEATEDESGLTDRGRDQAGRLGRRLSGTPFDAIHYSPKARAAETAEIIGGYLTGVPAHACDFVADRTPYPSDRRQYPERWRDWFDGVPESERDRDAGALGAAVERLGEIGESDRNELLVTHNFVIGWFVRHAMDAPAWRWLGLNQANCALSVVEWAAKSLPVLVRFNDTGHLEL